MRASNKPAAPNRGLPSDPALWGFGTLTSQGLLLTMFIIGLAKAEVITNTLDDVPPAVQCGERWTNQNIILKFTPTVASEDGFEGACFFGLGPGYVWLYPSRLRLDFSMLQQPISRIEADVGVYGGTALFAYNGTTNIAQTGSSMNGTFSLDFNVLHPDSCVIRSFEGQVNEIRVFTVSPPRLTIQENNGSIAVLWPTNEASYVLEKTVSFIAPSGWMRETNNIQVEGTNFVYHPSAPSEAEFLRLRHD